jgi:hypothetical protein
MEFKTDACMSSHGALRQLLLCPLHRFLQSFHPSLLQLEAPGSAEQLSGAAPASCALLHLQLNSSDWTIHADVPDNSSLAILPMI